MESDGRNKEMGALSNRTNIIREVEGEADDSNEVQKPIS